MNIVQCNAVSKSYGNVAALDEVTFSIKQDTITGIIGRNGAGKTTLLKLIAGYWKHSKGDIHVFSENPFNSLTVSANMIYIDDQMTFPDAMPLHSILTEAARFYPNWDAKLAKRLFDYFSFHPNQFHDHLSKGKKSTFNTIIGLASRCALTIFDEPTTGMDEAVRNDFYRALLRDYIVAPRTILISSHHLNEIEHLLEDVLLIDRGRVKLHLSIDALQQYAIGVTGNQAVLSQWANDQEILFSKDDGENSLFLVVRNNVSKEKMDQLLRLGIKPTSISPAELCLYMTQLKKGGIDDVFRDA
ncbi:ABC transporter ATP-binding protein [Virgibacillus sp. MG-45]|uniref:ABC transporter ATP-binding protein n=1 Tax=Virgibacillus sp. MG-45 TaxID=3102791 RepID=UPI002ED807C5